MKIKSTVGFSVLVTALAVGVFFPLLIIGCGGGDSTSPVDESDPPTIVINTPAADMEISGAVDITVSVTDTDLVRFYVDNQELGSDSSLPFGYSWNSGLVSNGVHTLRARATGPGGSTDSEIAILVNNDEGTVIVTLSPNEVSLETGQTRQFTATVTGAASTAVTWSVDGGSAWGTISATGFYTAPATVPTVATATVRATSVSSPTNSGTAAISLSGAGGTSQEEFLCNLAFGGAQEAVDLGEEALSWVVQAVWEASIQNGGTWTFHGTLTQTVAGGDEYTYSTTPADHLVLLLVGATPVEFTFTAFDGYTDGGWEDFLHSHEVNFHVQAAGTLDLNIFSRTLPPKDGAWDWTRNYIGWVAYEGETLQFNLSDSGSESYETNASFAIGETSQTTTGTASTADISLTINQTFWSLLTHSSAAATEARNFQLTTRNSATLDGHTYQYVGSEAGSPAGVRWETYTQFNLEDPEYLNAVHEPDYWIKDGGLLKDGVTYGLLEFTGPVIDGTWGPDLVLRTAEDGDILLHTLIVEP